MIDFSQRVLIVKPIEARAKSGEAMVIISPGSQMPLNLYQVYQERLAEFRPVLNPPLDELTLIAESLPESQYDLRGTVSSYKLLGIFIANEAVAVLARVDNNSLSRDILKVRVGDDLGGFRVVDISTRRIKVAGPQKGVVNLTLFDPIP
jgi:hypothetical protein